MDTPGMSGFLKVEIDVAEESIHENTEVESAAHGPEDETHDGDHTDKVTRINCDEIKREPHNFIPGCMKADSDIYTTDCLQIKQETVNFTQGVSLGYGVSVDSDTKPLTDIKQEADVTVMRVLPVYGASVDCGFEPDPDIKQEPSASITSGVASHHIHCPSVGCGMRPEPDTKEEPNDSFTPGGKLADVRLECQSESEIKQEPSGTFVVESSGAVFRQAGDSNIHWHTHTGEKPDNHGVSVRLSSQQKMRVSRHTDGKPGICTGCGASYSHVSHLEANLSTHTRERQFPCAECETSCRQLGDLKRHRRTHTPDDTGRLRPYDHYLELIPATNGHRSAGQRACKVCYVMKKANGATRQELRNNRKMTSSQCETCKVPLCQVPCFKIFHTSWSQRSNLKTHMHTQTPDDLGSLRTDGHYLDFIPTKTGKRTAGQRACKVCYVKKKAGGATRQELRNNRKMTSTQCETCKVPLCHVPCFKIYHTVQDYNK